MNTAILCAILLLAITNLMRVWWERRIAIIQQKYYEKLIVDFKQRDDLEDLWRMYRELQGRHKGVIEDRRISERAVEQLLKKPETESS